jgi:hypothetical protein
MTEEQVVIYNVRAIINRLDWDWAQKVVDIEWVINHTFPPYQGDMAIRNGLDPDLLPEGCRRTPSETHA